MKLYQFTVSSNNETVSLKDSFFSDTLELKSVYLLNSADLVEDLLQVEISFLRQNTNLHTSESKDLVIVPLDKTAGARKSKKNYHILFRDVEIPAQFNVKLFDQDGDPFDNAKLGKVLITFEGNSS